MARFGRVSTAMVTPFDLAGNIDFKKTAKLIQYLISNGTESIVVGGTTGESPTLTSEEKAALFQYTVKEVNGRIPVIAGTGSNDTRASIELTKKAEEAGADAVMLVTPYYNKPSQEGIFQHYKAIAESTKLPVMIYNVPGRTVVKMTAETIIRLAEIPNITAVKDASGDLELISEVIEKTSSEFDVYCGDDSLTLPVMAIGGTGIVSVASHVIGSEMQEMIRAFLQGDIKQAGDIHRKILPVMNEMFAAPSPAPVKTALQMAGMDVGSVRLPLLPLTESERNSLLTVMNSLHSL
ncbi:4-hydroxy-tetrahydrodipicolinate synthase [Bacillus sp. FJAT-42376]|uniref:4-hydroxy-tetrahydrodipicolinate synthase n=1 Tax=Bacillus sp. FJAT-42376 TaxID=2014076 RepID=UPI000F5054F1|nr:4-hydroxy-tetrahydrodipicolinate synthase [Bacillus sp. FJAT-42376]AZB42992.1 4-hydroxy-tetrahydrodipicolinate synthase [Bacillus sp. FJAT-42376]